MYVKPRHQLIPSLTPAQATKLPVAVQGPPALTSLLWQRTASSLLQEACASTSTPAFGTEADLVIPLLNQRGRQVGTYTLGGDVFNTTVRRDILHRVVRWQLAARQQVGRGPGTEARVVRWAL